MGKLNGKRTARLCLPPLTAGSGSLIPWAAGDRSCWAASLSVCVSLSFAGLGAEYFETGYQPQFGLGQVPRIGGNARPRHGHGGERVVRAGVQVPAVHPSQASRSVCQGS